MSLPPIYLSRVSLVKTTTTIDAQKTVALVSKVNINFSMDYAFIIDKVVHSGSSDSMDINWSISLF